MSPPPCGEVGDEAKLHRRVGGHAKTIGAKCNFSRARIAKQADRGRGIALVEASRSEQARMPLSAPGPVSRLHTRLCRTPRAHRHRTRWKPARIVRSTRTRLHS